jgi:hypothetical protein
MQQAQQVRDKFRPGDKAPESGVYNVFHHEHRAEHCVTLFLGEVFPRCTQCGDKVRFQLLRGAASIHEDDNFRS